MWARCQKWLRAHVPFPSLLNLLVFPRRARLYGRKPAVLRWGLSSFGP